MAESPSTTKNQPKQDYPESVSSIVYFTFSDASVQSCKIGGKQDSRVSGRSSRTGIGGCVFSAEVKYGNKDIFIDISQIKLNVVFRGPANNAYDSAAAECQAAVTALSMVPKRQGVFLHSDNMGVVDFAQSYLEGFVNKEELYAPNNQEYSRKLSKLTKFLDGRMVFGAGYVTNKKNNARIVNSVLDACHHFSQVPRLKDQDSLIKIDLDLAIDDFQDFDILSTEFAIEDENLYESPTIINKMQVVRDAAYNRLNKMQAVIFNDPAKILDQVASAFSKSDNKYNFYFSGGNIDCLRVEFKKNAKRSKDQMAMGRASQALNRVKGEDVVLGFKSFMESQGYGVYLIPQTSMP